MDSSQDNLTKIKTSEQAKEMGSRGGKRSGEVRRAKRKALDDAQWVLNLIVNSGKKMDPDKIKNIADVNGRKITVQQAGMLALAKKAIKGDRQALESLIEIAGERPSEKKDISIKQVISQEAIDQVEEFMNGESEEQEGSLKD